MIVRGMTGVNLMNYSILQNELEQETASLEDMHMFFVAFNQRQNKIIQGLEKAERVAQASDKQNLIYNDDAMQINEELGKDTDKIPSVKGKSSRRSSKVGDKSGDKANDGNDQNYPMNVILLKNEVDLE